MTAIVLSTSPTLFNFQNSLEILLFLFTDKEKLNNLPKILQPIHGRQRSKPGTVWFQSLCSSQDARYSTLFLLIVNISPKQDKFEFLFYI